MSERPILFVCSGGGHLSQLVELRSWWGDRERLWVSFESEQVRSTLEGERVIPCYSPTTRNVKNLVRNTLLAWRVIRKERPAAVVSTGAAVAVPFMIFARLTGIPTVYLEVYDRIDSPTLSGRICRPLVDLFLVQWPEQQACYPGSTLVGPLYASAEHATSIDTDVELPARHGSTPSTSGRGSGAHRRARRGSRARARR